MERKHRMQYEDPALEQQLSRRGFLRHAAGAAGLLQTIGESYRNAKEYDPAQAAYAEALALWDELDDAKGRAGTLYYVGLAYAGAGDGPFAGFVPPPHETTEPSARRAMVARTLGTYMRVSAGSLAETESKLEEPASLRARPTRPSPAL